MRIFESDIFGPVQQPESFEELVAAITDSNPENGGVRIWRGQPSIDWPVHSTAFRRIAAEKPDVSNINLIHYEESLLSQATHMGFRFVDGRELSDLELLARLRHHGAATRLVDATRSSAIGLWFAVSTHAKDSGALIGLHSNFMYGYEMQPEPRPYEEIVNRLNEREGPTTWQPTTVSPRVAAQHSQFLFSRLSDAQTGSLMFPEDEAGVLVIAITPDLKNLARKILMETFDIWDRSLFPDIEGFSSANSVDVGRWEMYRW